MAYEPSGDVNISFNFNVERDGPIDARTTVTEKTYLTDIDLPYPGMIVSVTNSTTASDNGVYILDNGDGSNLNDWTKITTGGSGITSLTTDATGYLDIDTTVSGTTAIPKLTINADSGTTPANNGIVARDSSGFAYVETAAGASNDKTIATTQFVKSTIASAITLIDGFNASSGALDSTGNLYNDTTELTVGNYYIVTTAGNFFNQTPAVNLNSGDYVVVQTAVSAGVTRTASNFIVVTQTSGVANINDIGLGNVNALDVDPSGGGGTYDAGVSVSYNAGTAVINNTDKGSAQNIFKTITINGIPADNFTATSNSTQLDIRQGTGISITKSSGGDLEIASTVSGGGMSSFTVEGNTGDQITISGGLLKINGNNKISTTGDSGNSELQINHELTTTGSSAATDNITSAGDFNSITGVTTDSYGHLTNVETTTFTMPTLLTGGGTDNKVAMFDGTGSTVINLADSPINIGTNDVQIEGKNFDIASSGGYGTKITFDGNVRAFENTGTNLLVGGGTGASTTGLQLYSYNTALVALGDNTYTNTARTVTFHNQVTIPETPSANASAASKKYVDDSLSAAASWYVEDDSGVGTGVGYGSVVRFEGSGGITTTLGQNPDTIIIGATIPTWFSVDSASTTKGAQFVNNGNINDNTQGLGTISDGFDIEGDVSSSTYTVKFGSSQASKENYIVFFTIEEPFTSSAGNSYPGQGFIQNKGATSFQLKMSPKSLAPNELVRVNFQIYKGYSQP